MDPIADRQVDQPVVRPRPTTRSTGVLHEFRIAFSSHRTAAVIAAAVLVLALITTVGLPGRATSAASALTSSNVAPSSAIALAAAAAAASTYRTTRDHRGGEADLTALSGTADLFATALGFSNAVALYETEAKKLPAAKTAPAPAPPSLANEPPLKPHEVFGFAPYWTLGQSASFDVSGISTLAYFSVGVNPDGTLDQSGAGWNGYESQALANLVTRAHAAGDKVVLTVNNFTQSQLDQLTHSATAPATLAAALVQAVEAKNLDGVNLDFEGQGSADNAGLTNLVATVSAALKAANPHYQVTMDTYSSSAAGSNGWFDIPALAPFVDAFFIMEYNPDLAATPSATSPLTSTMFSDATAIAEYTAAVPASKVILGLPYFGIDWPTSDGTLTATATGPATDVALGAIQTSGHPVYWDPVTDSAWTSYQVGAQWHETFFEDPTSLYDAAELAQAHGLAGVGIWALGMDATQLPDLTALDGFVPSIPGGAAGPGVTSLSPPAGATPAAGTPAPTTTTTTVAPTTTTAPPASAPAPTPTTTTTTTTTRPPPPTTTTTTTTPPGATGTYNGSAVHLTLILPAHAPPVSGLAAGVLDAFATTNPSTSCLAGDPPLNVWAVPGQANEYLAVALQPTDCTDIDYEFTTP